MNLKEAIDALLSGQAISPDARELLARFDPEALKEELSTLRSQLEEQENAKLSTEELLKKQLSNALSEKEELRKQHETLQRTTTIRRLAAEYGCEDPDYLDFLARKQEVDLQNKEAASEFLRETARNRPYCFRAPVQPGSGSGTHSQNYSPAEEFAGIPGNDRISRIVSSLNSAPAVM